MDFKKQRILIAGLGLIGGSAAKALKEKGFNNIYAYDKDGAALERAKRQSVIQDGFTALQGDMEKFDFVLCCLSPVFVVPLYKSVAPYLKDGGVFAEAGGIKTVIIKELEEAMDGGHELLSLHPMAGSEKKGYDFSSADMFAGSVLVVIKAKKTKQKALEWADVLFEALEFGQKRSLKAQEHDEIIAKVSHIPHVAALAVKAMNLGTDNELYAGGSYKSATRVAQINSALWAGLMKDNKQNLLSSIEELEEQIERIKNAVESRSAEELEELLNEMSGQE